MNKSIQPWQIAAIVVVFVALIAFFGVRWMNGGPNADVTQQNLKYYGGGQSKAVAPGGDSAQPGRR